MFTVSRRVPVLAVVFLLLAAAGGVRASSVTSMDLPTLVRLSAVIVRGEVDGARFIYPTAGFVDVMLNAATFTAGRQLRLTADFNGTATADGYLPLVRRDGTFASLAPGYPSGVLAPYATSVLLRFLEDVPLFSLTFSPTTLAGPCRVAAILVRAGADPHKTANWLGSDVADFSFVP